MNQELKNKIRSYMSEIDLPKYGSIEFTFQDGKIVDMVVIDRIRIKN